MWIVPLSRAFRTSSAMCWIFFLAACDRAALFFGKARSDSKVTVGLSGLVDVGLDGFGDCELGFWVGLLPFLPVWLAEWAPLWGLPPARSTVEVSRPSHHMVPATAATSAITSGTTINAR